MQIFETSANAASSTGHHARGGGLEAEDLEADEGAALGNINTAACDRRLRNPPKTCHSDTVETLRHLPSPAPAHALRMAAAVIRRRGGPVGTSLQRPES